MRTCLASYVDVHGILKAKAVPIDHFSRMMRGSELFTGAALDGLGQGPQDDELAVHPDPRALTVLPWREDVAWAPGNLRYRGSPWPMCSRNVLQRQVDRLAQHGLVFNLGVECEIFLVRKDAGRFMPANPQDTLPKAAYDVVGLLEAMDWLNEVVGYMNKLGWEVHSFDHEDANSQFEFDFAYSDVMTMADRFTLWRLMMKETARRRGWEATFMPKPYADRTGSGAHFNMSMSDIKTGSMTGYTWAPIFISYGGNNRTHMMRVPMLRPEIEGSASEHKGVYLSSARVECRAVDPTMNPYLAAAMVLAAGLEGIEQDLDPGDPLNINMYELSDAELRSRGIGVLPRTLLEAVGAFAEDPLSATCFGSDLAKSFAEIKEREWWAFHNSISSWEIDHYLTKF